MERFKKQCRLMGCSFELGVIMESESKATEILDQGIAEIRRIEALLSEFKDDSAISQINKNAGTKEIRVDAEVFNLLERSKQISKLSKGYFDITMGALKGLYKFNNQEFILPAEKDIQHALENVGYKRLLLHPKTQTAFLTQAEMRISLAAIGKGHAADVVRKLWKSQNVTGGYIDASGDLTAFGSDEHGEAWKIGIAHPDNRTQTLFHIPLHYASVATSGDYEQHFVHHGVRYSHNLNPITGKPVTGVKSVSIFSPSAELSDALATAVYAMGIEKGMALLEQLPQTHGIIINDENKAFFTKQMQYEPIPA